MNNNIPVSIYLEQGSPINVISTNVIPTKAVSSKVFSVISSVKTLIHTLSKQNIYLKRIPFSVQ